MERVLIICITLLSFVFAYSLKSEACPFSPSCVSTSRQITCGSRYGEFQFTHNYTLANGLVFQCGVTNESAVHSITCSGCGASYGNETRVCNIVHSSCGSTLIWCCQY